MGNKNRNDRANKFLKAIESISSIENKEDIISQKSKFNFAYFINNDKAGQDFRDWEHKQLYELFDKLKEYSKFPLSHWENEKLGKYPLFTTYSQFPTNTEFRKPKSVPHQAIWGRFHLEGDSRLIGFVLPNEYKDQEQNKCGYRFDTNTFYIVFLDKDHRFYKL